MIEMIRHCPDCDWDRVFEQHHEVTGSCPDSPDGHCPEWSCTECGAVLLIGFTSGSPGPVQAPERRSRVA